ncbi:hypothetical protein EPIRMAN_GEN20615_16670 [Ralstonia mannitolilytica]
MKTATLTANLAAPHGRSLTLLSNRLPSQVL